MHFVVADLEPETLEYYQKLSAPQVEVETSSLGLPTKNRNEYEENRNEELFNSPSPGAAANSRLTGTITWPTSHESVGSLGARGDITYDLAQVRAIALEEVTRIGMQVIIDGGDAIDAIAARQQASNLTSSQIRQMPHRSDNDLFPSLRPRPDQWRTDLENHLFSPDADRYRTDFWTEIQWSRSGSRAA